MDKLHKNTKDLEESKKIIYVLYFYKFNKNKINLNKY